MHVNERVALESYGAKGAEASRLLQQMAAHSLDRSPQDFLAHADRVLAVALQVGNAGVASQGTAELHLQAYQRHGGERAMSASVTRPQGRLQRARAHQTAMT